MVKDRQAIRRQFGNSLIVQPKRRTSEVQMEFKLTVSTARDATTHLER